MIGSFAASSTFCDHLGVPTTITASFSIARIAAMTVSEYSLISAQV